MGSKGSQDEQLVAQLQRVLLSWDYWELSTKAEEGQGTIADLRQVPQTFSSTEVCV